MAIQKILIVDDSITVRHFLTEFLERNNFQVVSAENGEQAISQSKIELPDIILMDVVMPGISGFQATRIITREELTKHIPVVLLTSKDQESDRVWGLRQGATDYITKPIDLEHLLGKIAELEKRIAGSPPP